MAKPSFFHILSTLKPDLVMYDFLQPWVPTMAASQNIPSVLFLTPGAVASCYLFHIGRKKPVSEYPFSAIYLRDHEYDRNRDMFEPTEDDGYTDTQRRVNGCIDGSSEIILIKTIRELEGKYMDFLSTLCEKRYVASTQTLTNQIKKKASKMNLFFLHSGMFLLDRLLENQKQSMNIQR